MTKITELTDAEKAKRALHEDRVSPNVERVNKQLSEKLWILYHAKDYALGVLQLLESMHLLRDRQAEEEAEKRRVGILAAFGPGETPREKGYKKLCYAAADALPPTFLKAVHALQDVRTDEELAAAEAPLLVDVHAWRHAGSSEDALALARVRKLVWDLTPRKTVPMQALRDALTAPAEKED
jgi:hypothetical protein